MYRTDTCAYGERRDSTFIFGFCWYSGKERLLYFNLNCTLDTSRKCLKLQSNGTKTNTKAKKKTRIIKTEMRMVHCRSIIYYVFLRISMSMYICVCLMFVHCQYFLHFFFDFVFNSIFNILAI